MSIKINEFPYPFNYEESASHRKQLLIEWFLDNTNPNNKWKTFFDTKYYKYYGKPYAEHAYRNEQPDLGMEYCQLLRRIEKVAVCKNNSLQDKITASLSKLEEVEKKILHIEQQHMSLF